LIDLKHDISVSAKNGVVHVKTRIAQPKEIASLERMAKTFPEVRDVKIDVREITIKPTLS